MDGWYWISNFSAVLGIILAIPPVYMAVVYLTRDRERQKKRLEVIRNSKGVTSAVLIINIGQLPIRVDVEKFIKENEELQAEEIGTNIFEYHHKDKILNESAADTLFEILKGIREIEEQLKEKGVQRLHLFYAGPIMPAAMIGAELSNRFIVFCYHNTTDGSRKQRYVLWGELQP